MTPFISTKNVATALLLLLLCTRSCLSFSSVKVQEARTSGLLRSKTCCHAFSRRQALATASFVTASTFWKHSPALATEESILSSIQEARHQLDSVPAMIKAEKWDSVRALLLKPPLSDCWNKNAPMLRKYAEEEVDDELAALEAREDAVTHLRFLDMAVYNNVFNPIATEGTAGATKELVRSYYEDPTSEWKASVAALEELIQLGKSQIRKRLLRRHNCPIAISWLKVPASS